jgi:hypothetical protein
VGCSSLGRKAQLHHMEQHCNFENNDTSAPKAQDAFAFVFPLQFRSHVRNRMHANALKRIGTHEGSLIEHACEAKKKRCTNLISVRRLSSPLSPSTGEQLFNLSVGCGLVLMRATSYILVASGICSHFPSLLLLVFASCTFFNCHTLHADIRWWQCPK